jgi:hypothetical protein
MREKAILVKLVMLLLVFGVGTTMAFAAPTGASYRILNSTRGTEAVASQLPAQAGNVTEVNFNQTSITGVWQGYFGNVSGKIVLANAQNLSMYEWNSTASTGQVYATRTAVSAWTGVNCTNVTNMEAEQTALSISTAWQDSVNKTFDGKDHPTLTVAGRTFGSNDCFSTNVFDETGGTGGNYYELLINAGPTVNQTIYTAIIDKAETGFDNRLHDFEMIVPVDTAQSITNYYFYVELL